jgi:hypothetical protein
MKKRIIILFWAAVILACWGCGQILAHSGERIFLLGQNKQAEVIDTHGRKLGSLALDEAPRAVITNRQGEKLFFCSGKNRWSLAMLRPDQAAYQKELQFATLLTAWLMNKDHSCFWAITRTKDCAGQAVLVKVDLENLEYQQIELDSPAVCLALNPAEDRLVVATLGKEPNSSNLCVYNPASLQAIQTIAIAKNPAALYFAQDNRTLLATSRGYNQYLAHSAPKGLSYRETAVPAGISYIDLDTVRVKAVIRLGDLSADYLRIDDRLYAITAEQDRGKVVALDDSGIAAEYPVAFIPRQIAVDPVNQVLYIAGLKNVAVFENGSARPLAQLAFERRIEQVIPLPESHSALLYHPTIRGSLTELKLNDHDYQRGESMPLGRGYMAAWKLLGYASSMYAARDGGTALLGALLATPGMMVRGGEMVMVTPKQKLYLYNRFTQDVAVVDTVKMRVVRRISCALAGRNCRLFGTPNEKYVIIAGAHQWRLLNTESERVELNLRLNWLGLGKPATPYFYHAPSGDQLILAGGKNIFFIDLEKGRIIRRIPSATRDAVIGR